MKEKTERNKKIRKKYKLGQGGVIGKAQDPPISRQRVFQIVSQKRSSGFLSLLLKKLWYWFKWLMDYIWVTIGEGNETSS